METKFKDIKNAGILGILGNIFLLIIKGFIGFASHSQSMIADAFNSASDILASLMKSSKRLQKQVVKPARNNSDFNLIYLQYFTEMCA